MPTPSREHQAETPDTVDAADEQGSQTELVELRIALMQARDAAKGAIAESGTLRARNRELEATIHALRTELNRLAHVEHSITYRVGAATLKPAKLMRRVAK